MNYQKPKGTQDVLSKDVEKWHMIEDVIRQFCYVYNYDEIRTPIFEHTNVFKRTNDSSDVVNKEMYTFTVENSSTSLTLRPEQTAGIVRSFVENKLYGNSEMPIKAYYVGPQFRHENPQKGRLRIFHQFGIEALGEKSPLLDVEAISLAWSFLSALGLNNLKVQLNTLGDEISRQHYREALQAHFKDDIKNMCEDCQRRYQQNPLRILDCKVDKDLPVMKHAPSIHAFLNPESQEYFSQVITLLTQLAIPYEIEDRLVRGLDYYTHTVFEIVSTDEEMGSQSTILAGGRYDSLIAYFGGPELSGIGWATGMERLLLACEAEGIQLGEQAPLDAYVLTLSQEEEDKAFEVLSVLRANGYRSDMDYAHRSFKAQFKSVERKQAKVVIFVGKKDLEAGNVTIKEIATQKQHVVKIEDMITVMDQIFANEEQCTCQHEEES